MKNKTKLGLAGIVLATTLTGNAIAQKNYIDGTINNVELSDKKSDSNYKVQGTVYFEKAGVNTGFYHKINKEQNNGELDFALVPEKEAYFLEDSHGNTTLLPSDYKSSDYIPTAIPTAVINNKKRLHIFELTNLPKEIEKEILKITSRAKNKSRKNSESSFGYTYEIYGNDIKSKLPRETINGQNYIYINSDWGAFIDTSNNQTSKEYLRNSKDLQKILLIPEESLSIGINPSTKEIILTTDDAFYNPVKENLQVQINKEKQETSENYYIVKPEDTFWKLSEKFYGKGKENVTKLMKKNNYKNGKDLKAGDKIIYWINWNYLLEIRISLSSSIVPPFSNLPSVSSTNKEPKA